MSWDLGCLPIDWLLVINKGLSMWSGYMLPQTHKKNFRRGTALERSVEKLLVCEIINHLLITSLGYEWIIAR